MYNQGIGNYGDVMRELSGGLGNDGLGSDEDIAAELGLDELGIEDVGNIDVADEIGARAKAMVRRAPVSQKGVLAAGIQRVVAQRMAQMRQQARGFQLLSSDPTTPRGAFGLEGSLSLLSFSGTVPAAGTLTITVTLDRRSTIRELRADPLSVALRVTNFTAAALPFAALQFPFSLSSFGPNVQDRKVRALSFEANSRFSVVLQNLTGADIPALLEAWGTPG